MVSRTLLIEYVVATGPILTRSLPLSGPLQQSDRDEQAWRTRYRPLPESLFPISSFLFPRATLTKSSFLSPLDKSDNDRVTQVLLILTELRPQPRTYLSPVLLIKTTGGKKENHNPAMNDSEASQLRDSRWAMRIEQKSSDRRRERLAVADVHVGGRLPSKHPPARALLQRRTGPCVALPCLALLHLSAFAISTT